MVSDQETCIKFAYTVERATYPWKVFVWIRHCRPPGYRISTLTNSTVFPWILSCAAEVRHNGMEYPRKWNLDLTNFAVLVFTTNIIGKSIPSSYNYVPSTTWYYQTTLHYPACNLHPYKTYRNSSYQFWGRCSWASINSQWQLQLHKKRVASSVECLCWASSSLWTHKMCGYPIFVFNSNTVVKNIGFLFYGMQR